jgi:hypothetical protein
MKRYKIETAHTDRGGALLTIRWTVYMRMTEDFPTGWFLLFSAVTLPVLCIGGIVVIFSHISDNRKWCFVGNYSSEEDAMDKIAMLKAKHRKRKEDSVRYYD